MKVLWHMKGLPRELKKHFPERPRVVLLGEPPREDGVGGGAVGCEEGGGGLGTFSLLNPSHSQQETRASPTA
jgi:hypothetical protein